MRASNAAPDVLHGARSRHFDLNDAYFTLLLFSLAGYALLGKGFAYVGVPPLLIGELLLCLGVVVILRSGCALPMLASMPSVLLATLLTLVLYRCLAAVGAYGLDAVRDGVIIIYGVFAFAVIALILEKPERIPQALNLYGRFAVLYGFLGGLTYYVTIGLADLMPTWPTSGVTIVYVRLGEAAVHIAGAAIFVLLGLRSVGMLWKLTIIASILMVTPSRGAMLACLIPITVAVVLGGKLARLAPILMVGAGLLCFSYATGLQVPIWGERYVGAQQLVDNFESIVGRSDASNLDGTKIWRLRWWRTIEDYTFNGPYFWTGKGFGMGLAEEDGFVVGKEYGTPIVRSPHNAHYTLLARMGVPGLVLWVALNFSWFLMMLHSWMTARGRGDEQWANVFLWIGCYELAALINATFDVALEGPMQGIWFWCLFGFGIATTMVYRFSTKPAPAP